LYGLIDLTRLTVATSALIFRMSPSGLKPNGEITGTEEFERTFLTKFDDQFIIKYCDQMK